MKKFTFLMKKWETYYTLAVFVLVFVLHLILVPPGITIFLLFFILIIMCFINVAVAFATQKTDKTKFFFFFILFSVVVLSSVAFSKSFDLYHSYFPPSAQFEKFDKVISEIEKYQKKFGHYPPSSNFTIQDNDTAQYMPKISLWGYFGPWYENDEEHGGYRLWFRDERYRFYCYRVIPDSSVREYVGIKGVKKWEECWDAMDSI